MKPSPAIVACGSDAAQPGLTRSLPRFHGADSWRPIAFAALLLAYVLLPAGFLLHGHDEGDATGDDPRHCVICCALHHAAAASAAEPAVTAPDVAVRPAAARTRRGIGPGATLGIRPTRGPPA